MDLREFLSKLEVKSGPNQSGEYMCRCPAHDDKKASLCVKDGDKGIVLCCQTRRCTTEDVVKAMGLTVRDLFHSEYQPPVDKVLKPVDKSQQPRPVEKNESTPRQIDKIYAYTDEDGRVLFEVVRYIPKDFRQRVPDPTAKGGYKWSIKGVRPIVYRLPEVLKAVADGVTVYIVEGEKDADNMALLGYVATTCPMGAGKWRSEHSAFLKDSNVCIIPDNDAPGREHAAKVARALLGTAKSVKVLDIASRCVQMPEKGDISDFFRLLGRAQGMEALEQLAADTPEYELSVADMRTQAAMLYDRVGGYCVDSGCICQDTNEGPRRLCTFVALPTKIITRDDGVNIDKVFEIDGWARSGKALPQVRVSAAKFPTMNWVLENWDFAANIMPGNTIKDRLRYVITEVGEMNAGRETVYTHMGWRQFNGQWVYLYPGGAIGADGIRVELDGALANYTLKGGDDIDVPTAAEFALLFRDAMAKHVSIPLLGLVYLTPLCEFLEQGGYPPRFAMYLLGGTGTHKTTVSQLALSHFGEFSANAMPASFHDTANSIRKKAFVLKDALLAVDDYHPETSMHERRRMEAIAQSLSRAFGDGADRGRMNSKLELQGSMSPRGTALMSGEDVPNIGESGAARFYIIHIEKGDIPINDDLEAVQDMARQGYLRRAMHGYIEWLAQRAPILPTRLSEIYVKLRKQALSQSDGTAHGRAAEAVAHIMLGYEMMLNYMSDVGAMTQEQADRDFREAWGLILSNSLKQGRDAREERPSRMFLDAVGGLLASKAASVKDLREVGDPGPNMIGYVDMNYYYLIPDIAHARVSRLYADQGMAFPLSPRMLCRQMREDGLTFCGEDGKATRVKNINNKSMRLLWIERAQLDGTAADTRKGQLNQQLGMEDFIQIEDDEVPF